ncbi:MFS transporter [Billgrantia desiderata SP1]|uniref:MFS transporter n=1 Tax=Billgrantia desiderata TaxID=52021 RepID=A0ABS9B6N4_9GAMM|nr:MFS transporter [Halomonas desiderata]MCE8042926.1 MFS transporter [Halomonas desiderata]MCE8047558.1 MFS transporter [Halomonas desiderata]OUE38165.1 MFS transporter [Halomonas desiderata SP1]
MERTVISRRVLLLTAAIAVIGANSLALSPIAATVAASFPGRSAADVVTAAALYGLATACSALLLASLSDRIGAERALTRALLVLSASLGAAALSPALWMLIVAQALAGLAAGVALPAIYTLTAQVAEKGRESQTLSFVLTGWTLSLVVGVGLAALLADLLHWRAVFSLLALAAVGLALGISRCHDWGMRTVGEAPSSTLKALRIPGIHSLLLNVAAYMTAFYGLYTYLGPHLGEVLQLPTSFAGLAIAVYGLGFGAAAPLGRLVDRYGANAAACTTFAGLMLVYLGLMAAAALPLVMLALCLAWGVANHLGLNLLMRQLAEIDPVQRGAIMGLYSAITYLCVFVGALLYRPIFTHFGFAACAWASAMLVLPALGWALGQWRRKQAELRCHSEHDKSAKEV